MTADLRTRLIAVIDAQQVSTYDGGIHPEDVVRLADAVIREIGMRQEAAFDSQSGQLIAHRYVTEWETDE